MLLQTILEPYRDTYSAVSQFSKSQHRNSLVVEATSLIAATIFGLAACGSLIVGPSSLPLTGVTATVSLISRETFCLLRNIRQLDVPVTTADQLANLPKTASEHILRGMIIRPIARPLLTFFFCYFMIKIAEQLQ